MKHLCKIRFVIIIFILQWHIYATPISDRQPRNWEFEHITTDNGLSNNTVNCIFQDKKGFLWFGTNNGLNKYDGYEITNFFHDVMDSNSISDNLIYDLCEDDFGNLWIGTSNGLNLYDISGGKFYYYTKELYNSSSIPDNCINTLLIDKDKYLWIGTSDGLARLDPSELKDIHRNKNPNFKVYKHNITDPNSISSNRIKCLIEDRNGDIWISTFCDGINVFDKQQEQFRHFQQKINTGSPLTKKIFSQLPNTCISAFYQDPNNDKIIWMGSIDKVIKFDVVQEIFSVFNPERDNSPGSFNSIHKSRDGHFILGTDGYGLYMLDEKKERFYQIEKESAKPKGISSNTIISIFEDNSGIIWIGTEGGGVSKLDLKAKNFTQHLNSSGNLNSIRSTDVRDICEDLSDGSLWIGTKGEGLINYKPKVLNYSTFQIDSIKNPHGDNIVRTSIASVYQIPKMYNYIWLGVFGKGLIKYDKNKNKFSLLNLLSPISEFIEKSGRDKSSLFSTLFINDIVSDKEQNLWIAARFGLYKYNPKLDTFTAFKYLQGDKNSISFDDHSCLLIDRKNKLWIGNNGGGIDIFNFESNQFIHYENVPNDSKTLSNNFITCLYQDKSGFVWIGTLKGLNRFSEKQETFKTFYQNDGLPSNRIHGILEDKNKNLWISTDKGLSRFNYENLIFRNFDMHDGLIDGEFNLNACYKSKNGELFFGGQNGFISFHPDSIKDNNKIPIIALTEFQLFNKKVNIEKDSPLKATISETEKIELNHDQNIFSFKFAALDYTSPQKNRYAYKMQGIDPEWVFTDASTRYASYTNLNPGEYTFRVKGSNNDGFWNEEGASIIIIIKPPWWQTWWAYIIYSSFIFFMFAISTRFYLNRQQLKHRLQLEHEHAEKLSKLDRIKSRFFTNISHEFRTPLTLIKGPAKQIINVSKNSRVIDKANLIYRNAEILNKLITQLLDLAKIEAGAMNLKTTFIGINRVVKNLILSFAPLAEKRNITLKLIPDEKELNLYLDLDKFEKIFSNLLSNAFKFTPNNGKIVVRIGKKEKFVEIKISDTGIGIPQEKISKIFDRFYQVDGSHTREEKGTGIGLALTKELVELHRGKIEVESKEGKGTIFLVKLPLGIYHLKPEEIFDNKVKKDKESADISEIILGSDSYEEKNDPELQNSIVVNDDNPSVDREKPLLLLVEDNKDVRKYAKGFLESRYNIEEASDGEEGLDKSVELIPDIIVSDVMMPKMDGFKLCEKLKTDERTSHIPVILLTAKAAREDKIEGLETGADDYVSKPFDDKELLVRIKNLIAQRKKLRQHFLKEGIFSLDNENIKSTDKKFLEKSIQIIYKNISNTLFGVEAFAEELAIGRTTLHKKIVSLVGESPSDLIKRIRLSKAAILLKKKSGNISEIALEVGFNNPAYFSECFKKQFSITPSQYQSNS